MSDDDYAIMRGLQAIQKQYVGLVTRSPLQYYDS